MDLSHDRYDGAGDGSPVLILHGLFGSARNWQAVAKRLSRGRSVYALDLRNHGASPWADDMGYDAMAADVAGFVRSERIERPAVIGHSMGGKVAMALAVAHPDLVARLMVVDIAPVTYPERGFLSYIDAMRAVPVGQLERRGQADARLADAVADPGVRAFLMQNLVPAEAGGLRWRVNLDAIERALPTIYGFPDPVGGSYDGPTLFLRGQASDYVGREHRPAIASLFPKARHAAIPDAGHWVHAEKPHAFLAAVEAFLAAEAAS